jgi:hypothetical protein
MEMGRSPTYIYIYIGCHAWIYYVLGVGLLVVISSGKSTRLGLKTLVL